MFSTEQDFWQRIYMEAYQIKRDPGTAKAHADAALEAYKEAFPTTGEIRMAPAKGRS